MIELALFIVSTIVVVVAFATVGAVLVPWAIVVAAVLSPFLLLYWLAGDVGIAWALVAAIAMPVVITIGDLLGFDLIESTKRGLQRLRQLARATLY